MKTSTTAPQGVATTAGLAGLLEDLQSIHENFHQVGQCREWWDRAHWCPVDIAQKEKTRFLRSMDQCGAPTVAVVLGISRKEARIQMEQAMKHNQTRPCSPANDKIQPTCATGGSTGGTK